MCLCVCVAYFPVWFKVKLHVKDAKTFMDKKKYVAFWLERYAKREPGMPLTVVFDMTDSGLSNIVSHLLFYWFHAFGWVLVDSQTALIHTVSVLRAVSMLTKNKELIFLQIFQQLYLL